MIKINKILIPITPILVHPSRISLTNSQTHNKEIKQNKRSAQLNLKNEEKTKLVIFDNYNF